MGTIGFIGGGNMATALARGLVADGLEVGRLRVADPSAAARDAIGRAVPGLVATADNHALCQQAELLVLAVKPQHMAAVAGELREALPADAGEPLLVSIAAGITLDTLRGWLGERWPMVRAMPNTPALIGQGITGLYTDPSTSAAHRQLAEQLMAAVGKVLWLPQEAQLDAVTAVSGSGPAYYFLLMDALSDAGQALGLAPAVALELSVATAQGAAAMAAADRAEALPELLRRVTSPGGTTERALAVLADGQFRDWVDRAVRAAADRSREMAAGG